MNNVINYLKKQIKETPLLYDLFLLFKSKEARTQYKLRRLVNNPQKQVDYMISNSILYGYGRQYPRTLKVDLKNPRYFNEKLLWLKYYKYNNDSLVAKCYDKYLVREYVESCGCSNCLNELYGVWERVEDIPWDKLPSRYIIKKTNGSGNHIIKDMSDFDIEAAVSILKRSSHSEQLMHITCGDLFANKTEQKYICEKLLTPKPHESVVDDYKFYCFNGEPVFLLYIWNRHGKTSYAETFKRINQNADEILSDASGYRIHSENINLQTPASFDEMLDICRKLSKPFPFVRVDLYDQDGKAVFGELTFSPAGGHVLSHVYKEDNSLNIPGLVELGDLIDLESVKNEK